MSFSREVRKAVRSMERDADRFVRNVNLEVMSSIILDTPVDTGALRGSWQTTENVPASQDVNRVGAGPAISQAETVLATGTGLFWLSNNKPYAEVAEYGLWGTGLNATNKTTRDGFSIQAPYGMVRTNAARIKAIVRKHSR